jgi:hypothetical protein
MINPDENVVNPDEINKNESISSVSTEQEIKYIDIPVSKLACLIGLNPYEHRYKSLFEFWKKVEPDDFYKVCNNLEESLSIKIVQENDIQILERIKTENGLDTIDKLKEIGGSDNQNELIKNQKQLINEINNSNLTDIQKEKVAKIIKSETNKSYGNHNEQKAIDYYVKTTGLSINMTQKKYTKVVAMSNGINNVKYHWRLVGKIDGMNSLDEVVEFKNRANYLFKTLKTYEKVQLQTYMKIAKKTKGHLIEFLKSNNDDNGKINIISQDFEPEFWTMIHLSLCKFIEVFHFIIGNNDVKKLLLIGDEDKIIEVIDQFFK